MARRKKNKVVTAPQLKELGGWKLGDVAWGIRVNHDVFRGTIDRLFEKIGDQPELARLIDLDSQKYITVELSSLVEESTKAKMRKLAKVIYPSS